MRPRKTVDTTLGELIVAVTDQIALHVPDPTAVYLAVECVLSDLMVRKRVRFHSHPKRKLRVYH